MNKSYDPSSVKSIEAYAVKLVGKTFMDVVIENTNLDNREKVIRAYGNMARKGGLGNLLEEVYFGYKANNDQHPDFYKAGLELKATPYEYTSKGLISAGERLVLTMISYDKPFESDFYKSHAWEKMRQILLVYYWRNKQLNSNLLYKIEYVKVFTPPEKDLIIIRQDYERIKEKIVQGLAHELSEGDTLYLGACTKGDTALGSTVPQYYNPDILAKRRAFCFKNSYMTFILRNYIAGSSDGTESIIGDEGLKDLSFEEYVKDKVVPFIGYTVEDLCEAFQITYERRPKNLESMLAFRILGIKGNHAEEFEKANIVVKSIRIEKTNRIKENMSFPTFQFKELIKEDWDNSEFGNYLRDTRFLFVVYKYDKNNILRLRGFQFWNIPYDDLENHVRIVWEKTKKVIKEGLKIEIVNGVRKNNLPKSTEDSVCHVRPHAQNAQDTYELPDGRPFPKQCFWLNNSYIYEQIDDEIKG